MHVEGDLFGIAELGAHFIDKIDVLAVHLEGHLVLAEGQAAVVIMSLLVGLYLVMTFDVFAVDFDDAALQGRTVGRLDVTFDGGSLRQTDGTKQDSQGGQGQFAVHMETSKFWNCWILNSSLLQGRAGGHPRAPPATPRCRRVTISRTA